MSHLSYDTSHNSINFGCIRSYLIGFILSIILTIIPFAIVMNHSISHIITLIIIISMAIIQVLVHFIYFLHINTSLEGRWNLVALLFTIMIISIVVVGSLWIMYNLNINMMVS
ncbi:cytochrome o ubiquinol oxidase operon protein [Serratia symbiotica str. 'Cinara cedri']|nr:cytochrome o ubiquinol oxidase operon protein [Serratia symbiotica str. 'Cinara cedri']